MEIVAKSSTSAVFTIGRDALRPVAGGFEVILGPDAPDPNPTYEVIDDRTLKTSTTSAPPVTIELIDVEPGAAITSLTPAYLEADPGGRRFNVVNSPPVGTQLQGRIEKAGFLPVNVTATVFASSSKVVVSAFTAGSFAKASFDAVSSLMVADEPSPDVARFSTYDPFDNFIESETCWAASKDFSGCVIATDGGQTIPGKLGGIAIGKRTVAFSNHAGFANVGGKVYFMGSDGVLVERTISAIFTSPMSGWDTRLALLDSDLPDEVTVYSLLPDLDGVRGSGGWKGPEGGPLCYWIDQNEDVWAVGYKGFEYTKTASIGGTEHQVGWASFHHLKNSLEAANNPGGVRDLCPEQMAPFYNFSKWPVDNDSGSPILLDYGGPELRFAGFWSYEISGPATEGQLIPWQAMVNELFSSAGAGTPDTLTAPPLSGSHNPYP